MPAYRMRYFLLFSLLYSLTAFSSYAEDKELHLDQYQWQKRIILSYPSSPESSKDQLKKAAKFQAEIIDRDLLILRLNEHLESHTPAQRQAIMKKYQLTKGSHVLIGKDGGVKDRQSGALDFEKWFRLIDTMPMRQNEMKR